MVELPLELVHIIASFSSPYDFLRLCTVSRAWQLVIESHTMRKVHIKSTDLQDFSKIFSHHNRRAALMKLTYDVVLPTYSDRQRARYESHHDKQQNNEALANAVQSLFSILHSWDEEVRMLGNTTASHQRPVVAGRISLILNVHSPTDVHGREHVDIRAQRGKSHLHNGQKHMFERRYARSARSFLKISRCDELPSVSRIRDFQTINLCHWRRIEGASLSRVAARLPNLETINWVVSDNDQFDQSVRQQQNLGKIIEYISKAKIDC